MRRRDFLKALIAVPVATAVALKATPPPTRTGISMRFVRHYDIQTDRMPARFDVLYGYGTLQPDLAVRIQG